MLYFTTLFTLCSPHPPHPPPHPNTAPIFERQNTGLVMIFCKFFFSNHQRSIKALIFSILGHNLLADSTTYCLSEDTVKISWSNVIACSSQIRVVVPSPASFRPERERESADAADGKPPRVEQTKNGLRSAAAASVCTFFADED